MKISFSFSIRMVFVCLKYFVFLSSKNPPEDNHPHTIFLVYMVKLIDTLVPQNGNHSLTDNEFNYIRNYMRSFLWYSIHIFLMLFIAQCIQDCFFSFLFCFFFLLSLLYFDFVKWFNENLYVYLSANRIELNRCEHWTEYRNLNLKRENDKI